MYSKIRPGLNIKFFKLSKISQIFVNKTRSYYQIKPLIGNLFLRHNDICWHNNEIFWNNDEIFWNNDEIFWHNNEKFWNNEILAHKDKTF